MASCCYGRQNGNSDKTPSFEHSAKARQKAMFGPKLSIQEHHNSMTGCAANGVDQSGVTS
jgi:hypothetical protein